MYSSNNGGTLADECLSVISEYESLLAEREQLLAQEPDGFMIGSTKYSDPGVAAIFETDTSEGYFVFTQAVPAQQVKEPRGTNEYGLDIGYMAGKLNMFLRDIDRHTPDEAARVLARLAMVADEKVLAEPEFVKPSPAVAVPDVDKLADILDRMLTNNVFADYKSMAQALLSRLPTTAMPPRITEQDATLKLVESVIAQLEDGFVRCSRCGDQEDTKDLDVMHELKDLRALLNKLNDKPEICELCESLDSWQQAEGTKCPAHTKPESVGVDVNELSNELRMELVSNHDYIKSILPSARHVQILKFISDRDYAYSTDIAALFDITLPNASARLHELWRNGWLKREDVGHQTGGSLFKYKKIFDFSEEKIDSIVSSVDLNLHPKTGDAKPIDGII